MTWKTENQSNRIELRLIAEKAHQCHAKPFRFCTTRHKLFLLKQNWKNDCHLATVSWIETDTNIQKKEKTKNEITKKSKIKPQKIDESKKNDTIDIEHAHTWEWTTEFLNFWNDPHHTVLAQISCLWLEGRVLLLHTFIVMFTVTKCELAIHDHRPTPECDSPASALASTSTTASASTQPYPWPLHV